MMLAVLYAVIREKGKGVPCRPLWDVILSRVLLGRTVVFGLCTKQELSYRQQIARQLRTQFVEGISVTLKSTLRVTQGHWKRNQWTAYTTYY